MLNELFNFLDGKMRPADLLKNVTAMKGHIELLSRDTVLAYCAEFESNPAYGINPA